MTPANPSVHERNVVLRSAGRRMPGMLRIPESPSGIVVFAHGSGSSRHSPRNRFIARQLEIAGFATLLMDLLEPEEAMDRSKVFDLELLSSRLLDAAAWLKRQPESPELALGYFGASTGAAAALVAAACEPDKVSAIVSRGGRPDMAFQWLKRVQAPTLLIVGSNDEPVLQWNRDAYEHLSVDKELVVVKGATHLFEEPGALSEVAKHACRWFARHLKRLPVESTATRVSGLRPP